MLIERAVELQHRDQRRQRYGFLAIARRGSKRFDLSGPSTQWLPAERDRAPLAGRDRARKKSSTGAVANQVLSNQVLGVLTNPGLIVPGPCSVTLLCLVRFADSVDNQ